jgi:signal transduction histidine kinase/ActR/RegA family two-component response regulator
VIPDLSERALILAPIGRDATVAQGILTEAKMHSAICAGIAPLCIELGKGAGFAIVTEEALRTADLSPLAAWIDHQPEWSDFPFILVTVRGGGVERNPAASRLLVTLGNVTFVERPFHPTTLVSLAEAALRGRRRQYDARARLRAMKELNDTLEARVESALAEQRKLSDARLSAEVALRHAQKLEAVGQLTGGVAHDFNNLLMVISSGLTMLERPLGENRRHMIKEAMLQAVERGSNLTRQLLGFSRNRPLETKTIDLVQHLGGMREMLDRALGGNVTVALFCPDQSCAIDVDPGELELAVLNLCVNARDAMPRGGTISISARSEASADGKTERDVVRLTVSDTGVGMSDEVKQRVFEPFFTTKEIGKGSGLGLAQVYGFAMQSNAEIAIESAIGQGTAVILTFLRSGKNSGANADVGLTRPGSQVPLKARVLLVEDDEQVTALTTELLNSIGCTVTHAPSAASALEVLDADSRIDIVFADVMMPGGLSGADLAEKIRRTWPKIPVLLATGYIESARHAAEAGIEVLEKPYRSEALERALRRQLMARDTPLLS